MNGCTFSRTQIVVALQGHRRTIQHWGQLESFTLSLPGAIPTLWTMSLTRIRQLSWQWSRPTQGQWEECSNRKANMSVQSLPSYKAGVRLLSELCGQQCFCHRTAHWGGGWGTNEDLWLHPRDPKDVLESLRLYKLSVGFVCKWGQQRWSAHVRKTEAERHLWLLETQGSSFLGSFKYTFQAAKRGR